MKSVESLLEELIDLQKASIRLQKFLITLQAESFAHTTFEHSQDAKIDKQVSARAMKTVKQIRATLDKIEKGKSLPK